MPKVLGNSKPFARENKPKGKCRKWQLRVLIEDDFTHKKRYVTKCMSGITYTEAQNALDEWKRELEDSAILDTSTTFGEYAERWLQAREDSPKYANRTVRANRERLSHVLYHLDDVPISKFDSKMINALYARLSKGDTKTGNALAGTYCRDIHATLTRLLRDAQHEGLLDSHAFDGIEVPKLDTEERIPLTNDEVSALLDKLDTMNYMHMMLLIAVTCGLRRSEMDALTWRDIDGDVIHVRRAAEEDASTKLVKVLKSSRAVPMPIMTRTMLDEWKENQAAMLRTKGIVQVSTTPVISMTGNPIKPHSMDTWWRRHRVNDFGVDCSIHDLRHTYATMLARKGVHMRVAADLIGDSSMHVISHIYTHVADEDKREAVERLDSIF